ncbi:polymorphic toxin-type HINT domain-containing protein [Stieleria varia]|uniref:Hint domain-containing protein n=1 Tax=Stieleria varia TaxID=2528005 RepID=A0A5C6B8G0_9BACT|nr:polymorphic toxin-type HINT domain-containing protein [Stieleria varia]TWU07922.1 hypothetical protein Pla52n_04990 [Stieleria varia]
MSRRSLFVIAISILLKASFACKPSSCVAADPPQAADVLVQAALQSEVDRNPHQRLQLLAESIRTAPEHAASRWHSGHVMTEEGWLPVQRFIQQTNGRGAVARYNQLRDSIAGTAVGEITLARFCNTNGLNDRERLHWNNVLRFDRSNQEARKHLDLHEYRGQLLTPEQILQWKATHKEYRDSVNHWDNQLRQWRGQIDNTSPRHHASAWRALSEVTDYHAVPSLEKMFYRTDEELQEVILSVLGNIREPIATDALVRLAIYNETPEVREAAALQLRDRSWYEFVPAMMNLLETPIEYQYTMQRSSNSVSSFIQIAKETSAAKLRFSEVRLASTPIRLPSNRGLNPGVGVIGAQSRLRNAQAQQQRALAQETWRRCREIQNTIGTITNLNRQRFVVNHRIYDTLELTTGQEIDAKPQAWWDWWNHYNEITYLNDKEEKTYLVSIDSRVPLECFVPGTLTWTDTGKQPIETIKVGDRVLSQDPVSGELAYRLVTKTTIREPSPTLRIQVADSEIVSTLGHPMWVVGSGWKMAKELAVGDRLHSLNGGTEITDIRQGDDSQTHNLVVENTSTYFVGNSAILVHDSQPRTVSLLPLPGWKTSAR